MNDDGGAIGAEVFDPAFLRETAGKKTAARKRPRLRAAVLFSLAILIAFATFRFIAADRPQAAVRPRAFGPQSVAVSTIARGDIDIEAHGLGSVTPLASVTVKTQVNGQLISVAFREGDAVKKGDVLAQIDPRPYELARAQYEGQLARDRGLLDQARADQTRYDALVKQNSLARKTAEDQAFLIKQYEGAVIADRAQIDAQNLNLDYARIACPIDGVIGLRMVDPGNYLTTSNAGVALLTQVDPISVIFTVPEDAAPQIMSRLKAGAPLEVTLYDRANVRKLASGRVSTIDNQIDATTATVKIRAEFANPDHALFPNQFVNVTLLIKALRGVLAVPLTALDHDDKGAFVYVIGPDDTASLRRVELGAQGRDQGVVLSGLAPGDRVVVDGADRLRDGAKVAIALSDGAPVALTRTARPGRPQ